MTPHLADIVHLPFNGNAEALDITNVRVAFLGYPTTVNLGCMCYVRRETQKFAGGPVSIDPDSLDVDRRNAIYRVFTLLSNEAEQGVLTSATLSSLAAQFRRFVDWCDRSGHTGFLFEKDRSETAFVAYCTSLSHATRQRLVSLNTAARYQRSTLNFLRSFWDDPAFALKVTLLSRDKFTSTPTEPPDAQSQARVLALCSCLFEGISKFILDFEAYPYALKVPARLEYPNNEVWIFPTQRWFLPPGKEQNIVRGHAYNYHEGRIATSDELSTKVARKHDVNRLIEAAKRQIDAANRDQHHCQRRRLAIVAHNVFVLMFVANTGMNLSQVCDLKWNSQFDISNERQGFKSIKYRAAGKPVFFEIQSVFFRTFKIFLDIRKYLLGDSDFNHLFLRYGWNPNADSLPLPLSEGPLRSAFSALSRFDPNIPRLLSRRWRAAKSDYLVRKYDLSTASTALQNTEETVRHHYLAGSTITAATEMTAFLDVLLGHTSEKRGQATAVGSCIRLNSPEQIISDDAVQANCLQPEGCLTCANYRFHPDATDIRKLLSCRYCIVETSYLSKNIEHFQKIFGATLIRIDQFLSIVSGISTDHSSLISTIRTEVDEGELDVYWARKLEMLIALREFG